MVYFKMGKFAVKTYNCCPDRNIYLKRGTYILNVSNDTLSCISHDDILPVELKDFGILQFYVDLDIDFKRDSEIQLSLDKKGIFRRMDDVDGSSSIESLFCCPIN